MNAAIAATRTRTWKLVKAHYLAMALGAALALSAVIGVDKVDFSGSSSRATAPAVSTLHSAQPATIYIVGSQERAGLIIDSEGLTAGYGPQVRPFEVFVAETPETEQQLRIAMDETQRAGSNLRFLDLRSP